MQRSRRALVGGGLALTALGALEASSLLGAFDHRVVLPGSGRESVARALAEQGDSVLHIGHSTHVVELERVRLLTDPWFSDPAFGALAHALGPACTLAQLATVDAILLSHEHPDHADLVALERFGAKSSVAVLAPTRELALRVKARGFSNVHVLAPWESFVVGEVRVEAVPALHDVPEVGYVLSSANARVLFAGDTAFHRHFPEIRERCRPSFALLPVDGTRLRGSAHTTLDALEAVTVARLLGVAQVMPSHAEARFTDPFAEHVLTATSSVAGPERFRAEMSRALPGVACHVPRPGERVVLRAVV